MAAAKPGWDDKAFPHGPLTTSEALELEARLRENPFDRAARRRLMHAAALAKHTDAEQREGFREHCLWFIEHHPASKLHEGFTWMHQASDPVGFAKGRDLWLAHVQRDPENLAILGNAAWFLAMSDFEQARPLLERAEALDPDNVDWPTSLAVLCAMHSQRKGEEHDLRFLRDSLDACRRAVALSKDPLARCGLVQRAARTAMHVGEIGLAREFALELLDAKLEVADPEGVGADARFIAHSVLGTLALRSGDLDLAARELIQSGDSPGSCMLRFMPNLELADALLQQGRAEAVLEFLELCGRFWDKPLRRQWIERIRAGERPKLDPWGIGEILEQVGAAPKPSAVVS